MTDATDPIAAARALLDARPAVVLKYEQGLMDMVATLADSLEAEQAEVVALQDLNAAVAGEAGKLWAENQRLSQILEAARFCLDFMAAGEDEAAKMAKLAISAMDRAALRSTEGGR